MPIRLNLLADQLAEEELRRRDPVKRAFWAGGVVVALALVGCGYLQLKIILAGEIVRGYQEQWQAKAKEYEQVTNEFKRVQGVDAKLDSLRRLATDRFLVGPLLNSMQFAAVPGIQVQAIRTQDVFTHTDTVSPRRDENGNRLPGKPATATEKLTVTIEGKAFGNRPGDQAVHYRDIVAALPYFRSAITNDSNIRLGGLSAQQTNPQDPSRSYVLFTLDCSFLPVTRE